MNTKFVLCARGTITMRNLNIMLNADTEADARLEAVDIAKCLAPKYTVSHLYEDRNGDHVCLASLVLTQAAPEVTVTDR